MTKPLYFIVLKKWSYFFSFENFSKVVANLLLLFISFFIAKSIKSAQNIINQGIFETDHHILTTIVYKTVIALPIFSKFFPVISQKKTIINNHYPLSEKKAANFELLYSIISNILTYCIIIFSVTVIIGNQFIGWRQSCYIFLGGAIGLILSENFIYCYHTRHAPHIICILIASIFLIAIQYFQPLNENLFTLLLILALIVCYSTFIFFYRKKRFNEKSNKGSWLVGISKNIFLKATINNKRYINAVVFSILLQFCFTIISMKYAFMEIPHIKYYVFSLVFLYSYCFNNIWGFFPSIALNSFIANRRVGTIIKFYSYLTIPVLSLQIIINMLLLFFLYQDILSFKFIIGSLSLFAFITSLGIFFSFTKAKKIGTEISLNTLNRNSSLIPLFIFGAASLIMGAVENTIIFWPFSIFLFIVSLFVIYSITYNKSHYFLSKLVSNLA